MYTCNCGRVVRNTRVSINQHEKTKVHKTWVEQQNEVAAAAVNAEVAETERKLEEWEQQTIQNIMQTKREIKAATTIQWWWRRVSANPANHVGLARALKLWQEL